MGEGETRCERSRIVVGRNPGKQRNYFLLVTRLQLTKLDQATTKEGSELNNRGGKRVCSGRCECNL